MLKKHHQKILIFASFFTIFEILRSILFTGFPWNLIGYSLIFSDYTAQIASVIGIFGLSFLAILFCLIPIAIIYRQKIFSCFLIILFLVNFCFGFYKIHNIKLTQSPLKLRLVQGNIEQNLKWDRNEKYQNFLKHIAISNQNNDADFVIWSETSVPYPIMQNDIFLMSKLQEVANGKKSLITGALRLELDENENIKNAYNSIFAINENQFEYYDKQHLVPFGEYIPLQKFLPFVTKITDGNIGFSSGKSSKTIEINNLKFSPLICYEIIFPNKIIDEKNRPQLLINLTNDAWFGKSTGPYQHLMAAKMRAIEYGISVARVANTGITAYIDPFGRITQKIDLQKEGFFDSNLILPINQTIFSHFKYFVLLLIIFAIFIAFLSRKFDKNEKF